MSAFAPLNKLNNELPLQAFCFPSRFAATGLRLKVPCGWVNHTLPDEDSMFDQAEEVAMLARLSTPDTALSLTVSARPAFDDGAVSDWAALLLEHSGLQFWTLDERRLGRHAALAGEGVRATPFGPARVHFAFAEDGQRLLMLHLEGPEALAEVLNGLWTSVLDSFVLHEPFGPTVTLWPPLEEESDILVQPMKHSAHVHEAGLIRQAATIWSVEKQAC